MCHVNFIVFEHVVGGRFDMMCEIAALIVTKDGQENNAGSVAAFEGSSGEG